MKTAHDARQIAIDNSMDIVNIYLQRIENAAKQGKTSIDIQSDPIYGGVLAYFLDNGFKVFLPVGRAKYGSIEW